VVKVKDKKKNFQANGEDNDLCVKDKDQQQDFIVKDKDNNL